jgi:Tfp pilus assembly protein PilV
MVEFSSAGDAAAMTSITRGGRVAATNRLDQFPANRRGFSVVEVMMATTILLVGFIGLIQAITIGSESLDNARKNLVARQIIAAEIEKLRGGAWSAIAALPASGSISISAAGAISGDFTSFALTNYTAATTDDNTHLASLGRGFNVSFSRTRLRPNAATAANVTFVKVVYTVTWSSNTGRARHLTEETYLGANGLHLSNQL